MNLEKAGIAQEKIPEYQKSLEDFSNIRKELLSMRIILKVLFDIPSFIHLLKVCPFIMDSSERYLKILESSYRFQSLHNDFINN